MLELDPIRKRLEAAQNADSLPIIELDGERMISEALKDIPALLDEVERLRNELMDAYEKLDKSSKWEQR